MYKTNTQNYNIDTKIKYYRDFIDNEKEEIDDLKKTKKSFIKNQNNVGNIGNKTKFKWNKTTKKIDDISLDIIDDKIEELLKESVVVYSSAFKDIVKKIDSPVANYLLEIEEQDLPVKNNYFDISDDNGFITFIMDGKSKEIDKKYENIVIFMGGGLASEGSDKNRELFQLLKYIPADEKYVPSTGDVGEIVRVAESPISGKTFAYVKFKNGRRVINTVSLNVKVDTEEKKWKTYRQRVRIGRAIRSILNSVGKEFTQAQLEDFINKYKSNFDIYNDVYSNFMLVSGEDIGKYYNIDTYENSKGQLGSSCMARAPMYYFQIYMNNPEVCSLLVLKNDSSDKIKGRALVWKLSSHSDKIYMDRIYTNDDSDVELFREYAIFRGWCYKKNNRQEASGLIIDSDKISKNLGNLYIKLNNMIYNYYPYMDTFKFYDPDKYTLNTVNTTGECYLLESTGGDYITECEYCGGSGRVECSECSGDGDLYCDDCDGDGTVGCDTCDNSGEVESTDEMGNIIEITCDDCGGSGEVSCDNCDGSGRVECYNCYGNGQVDCYECN